MLAALSVSRFGRDGGNALQSAIDWITGTLLGSVAIVLCVLAVAYVGFLLLTGRVAVREGLRVVLGCFLLLGAPVIAAALMGLAPLGPAQPAVPLPEAQSNLAPREELPAADYDPYTGASRRE